jgi:hypothetical protein
MTKIKSFLEITNTYKSYCFISIYYLIVFFLVFLFTLNTNYVEGDDASTILYHILDRNENIQKPYASYNSGFDFVLNFFSSENELLLRNFSVYISFIFGLFSIILLFFLVKSLIKDFNKNDNWLFILLPFIIPEILFNSLIINSVNISFSFSLLSLLFFVHFLKNNSLYKLILSVFFMAIAIPFRWSIVTIFPLFFVIIHFFFNFKFLKIIYILLIHHIITILLGILFLKISGYDIDSLINTVKFGTNYMEKSERKVSSLIAISTSFLLLLF